MKNRESIIRNDDDSAKEARRVGEARARLNVNKRDGGPRVYRQSGGERIYNNKKRGIKKINKKPKYLRKKKKKYIAAAA